jgi:hypothetical protein
MTWLQKDNLLSNEQNVFGFTTTLKLSGAEICIAKIQQAYKFEFSTLTNFDFSSKVIDQSAASEVLKIRAGASVINIFFLVTRTPGKVS